jgi:hypothetical protein
MVNQNAVPRVTVGQMLADTQKEHEKQQIEVGEFVEEVGNKEVMKEVWKQIDARAGLPQWKGKFYILVWFKKNAILHRVVEVYVQSRHTAPMPEPGLTCFSYNTSNDNLILDWVLPDKHAFKTFLKTREYTDPFLMKCIDEYLSGKLK